MYWHVQLANMTKYVNLKDINQQQEDVMRFIIEWVKTVKTPVPKKEVIAGMKLKGVPVDTIEWSLDVLLAKGYVRRAYMQKQNTTAYVQLRTLSVIINHDQNAQKTKWWFGKY